MSKEKLINPDLDVMKSELKELGLNPDTFCFAPYMTTDLDQNGTVYTCYRGKTKLGDWKHDHFDNAFNGEELKQIREDLYNGTRNKNCKSCYRAEDNNSASPRLHFYYDYMYNIARILTPEEETRALKVVDRIKNDHLTGTTKEIVRAEIRPSSLCNLRCMHCGPHSSTKWVETLAKEDNLKIYMENDGLLENGEGIIDKSIYKTNLVEHYKNCLTSETDYKDEILELLSNCRHVSFTGGEPLLTPEHPEYLQHFIDAGVAPVMTLEYNTNLNVKNLEKFFPLWKHFKRIVLRVSLDASFDTYEYFRTYGNIEIVKSNFTKLRQFHETNNRKLKVNATITFNFFSALRWRDILNDWLSFDLMFHTSLVLDHPTSVKYMPNELKEHALAEMQWCVDNIDTINPGNDVYNSIYVHHTQQCINYTAGFNNDFEKFPIFVRKYIDFCDKTSGNSYKNYYPEIAKYLE